MSASGISYRFRFQPTSTRRASVPFRSLSRHFSISVFRIQQNLLDHPHNTSFIVRGLHNSETRPFPYFSVLRITTLSHQNQLRSSVKNAYTSTTFRFQHPSTQRAIVTFRPLSRHLSISTFRFQRNNAFRNYQPTPRQMQSIFKATIPHVSAIHTQPQEHNSFQP